LTFIGKTLGKDGFPSLYIDRFTPNLKDMELKKNNLETGGV